MQERDTLKINKFGHLEIADIDTVELVKKFGTPLYVLDERYIRDMCKTYRETLKNFYDDHGVILYASKALSCTAIYALMKSEKIGVDVVSGGELYTAMKVNFPPEKICLHGNNKLTSELRLALNYGVGRIVVDSISELERLNALCAEMGVRQKILLRVNPGVEAHTHHYIQTAKTDSKFGFSLSDGTALQATKLALSKSNLLMEGYHCHIGSQIFEQQSFALAAKKMMQFAAEIRKETGFVSTVLNMGGGYGIWYTEEDRRLEPQGYAEYLKTVFSAIKEYAQKFDLPLPYLLFEPGRSIVGEAGITLYTVGAIKEIPGVKKYVSVDGGMFENPRYALYQAKYTPILANRANEKNKEIVTIAGKCCESGDIICADVSLPESKEGDILAVLSTGAYNYSMASNYNRNPIPPVILVLNGEADYIVKPQTYDDIIRNDVVPDRLK